MKKYFLIIVCILVLFIIVGCDSKKEITGRWYYSDTVNMFLRDDKTCDLISNGKKEDELCTWKYENNKLTIQTNSYTLTGRYHVQSDIITISNRTFYRDLDMAIEKAKEEKKKTAEKNKLKNVIVPDVRGMTINAARETLQKNGFTVAKDVEYITDDEIGKNLVVKTSPSIGREIKKGTEIILFVSQ